VREEEVGKVAMQGAADGQNGREGWLGDPFSFLLNLYYNISKNLLKE
jgi:hypothetical protein